MSEKDEAHPRGPGGDASPGDLQDPAPGGEGWLKKALAGVKRTAEAAVLDAGISRDPARAAELAARRQKKADALAAASHQAALVWEQKTKDAPYVNRWPAQLLESTLSISGVKKYQPTDPNAPPWVHSLNRSGSRQCSVRTDPGGVGFYTNKAPQPAISIPWASVVDIRLDDATSHAFSSRIDRPQQPLSFRTTPVARPTQKTFKDANLTIETTDGAYLFRLFDTEVAVAQLRIEATRRLWGGAQQQETDARSDPFDQLRNLHDLHAAGILSTAEYDEKKAEILKRI